MTSLIKRGGAADVHPLEWRAETFAPALVLPPPPPTPDPVVVALRAEIRDLQQALECANADAIEATTRAREQGRADAEAAYARDDAKALTQLEAGLVAAAESFRQRLASLEGLASIMSETALGKVLGDAHNYADLISQTIRKQIEGLRRDTVIGVSVSAADFTDETALRSLAGRLTLNALQVVRGPNMSAGDCRIDLRLGHIEISLGAHWHSLRALLQQWAGGSESP